MANPTKYTPGFSYSGFEASNPGRPKPGAQLDNDFAKIEDSIGETVDALADVRRSDGALKNGIVTTDALADAAVTQAKLAPAVLAGIAEAEAAAEAAAASAQEDAETAAAAAEAAAQARAYVEAETIGTRANMVTRIAGGYVPSTGSTHILDGVVYRGLIGSTVIPDLNGLTHGPDGIAPDHMGGKNRAHIEAAWAHFVSVGATGAGADLPPLSAVTFLFLGGRYNADSTSVLVLETTGAGQRIEFRNNALIWHATIASRRKNLEILNPYIVGGTYDMNAGLLFEPLSGESFRGGFVRNPRIFNVRNTAKTAASIRAKGNAAHIQVSDAWLQGSDYNYVAEAGDAGGSVGGMLFSGLHALNARVNNIRLSSGGENRFVNYRIRAAAQEGVLITGNADQAALEQYFGNGGITGNHTDLTTRASNPITTITDEGGFAKVTITGSHMFWSGLRSCRIQGTGISAYDDTTDVRCIEVGADYVVTNVAYAGDATGSLVHCGFDVKLESATLLAQVNDVMFNGPNINSIGLFGAYNISLFGCRLKVNAWASGCNSIYRIGGFRGREGDPAWDDVPFVGQTGGIYEIGLSVPEGADRNTLATFRMRAPRTSDGLSGNKPVSYNSVGVHPVDGVVIEGAVTENGTGLVPSAVAKRLGSTTLTPFVLVIEGQSNALGSGTGQDTTIDQSGGGVWIYSRTDGGAGGTMVAAEYGVAPLNRAYGGGTTATPSLAVGNIGPHAANRIRELQLIAPDRPIWILINAIGGLNISEWVDSPYTREVAFEAAMAEMSDLWGETLTVDHLHWQQGEANGTTAPPYNTDATYFDALTTWYEARKQSQYWGSETTVTVGEILSSRPYITTDTAALVRPTNARNPALRRFASAAINPKIAIVPTSDLTPNGTLAQDANHFSGQGLQTIGERAANRFVGLRAGTISGAHIAPDGRPILTHPQLSFSSETVYLGQADVDTGTTFIRSAAATINLPLIQTSQNVSIYVDVWSDSGGDTVVNCNTTMEGPLGLVETVSLGLGTYKFYYLGRWQFTAISPQRGDYLHYARANLAPQEVYGLTKPQARGAVINSFAGCLIGLPSPEQGAEILIKQRSITTYGAATLGRACQSVAIASGGSGYAVGDTIVTALGGASGVAPTLTVNAVSGGVITGVDLTAPACITSSAVPTNPVAQASTSGSGTGATFNLTYSSALIAGPGPTDSAASYSLGTVGQIVDLVAVGGVWNVASDNTATARASSGTWTPGFTNSVPGDLVVSSVTINNAILRYVGPMVYVSASITFTPTHTTATGAWQITGLPAYFNTSGVSLTVRGTSGISLPAGGDGIVLVLDNAASGTMKLRTARPDTDLPVANIASGSAITLRIQGWLPLP